jgi:UDP-glucose 4-epimerase
MFTGKTLLITGGTGIFGNAVLRRFQSTDIGEIRILSRDEKMWFTETGAQMIGRLNL